MKYPAFIKEGGKIGLIAPSMGCTSNPYKEAFKNALKNFDKFGFRYKIGPNCLKAAGVGISNEPPKCGMEFMDFYLSEDTECLISCGGGELMCEILDYVDFEAIQNVKPKWFMGFSDNTNLTFLLTTLCDTASVYGPCAPAFGMEPWHSSLQDAWKLLRGETLHLTGYDAWEIEKLKDEEHPLLPYNCTQKQELKIFLPEDKNKSNEIKNREKVRMRGRLLGGCMDCLVNLTGTCYDKVKSFAETYKEDGIIWFLEACDLNVFSIRRAIWQMNHAGWFHYVKGFLIGRPLCYGQELMGLNQYEAVLNELAAFKVPIVMNADLGHLPPSMPLITGSLAEITADSGKLDIKMELL